MLKAFWLISPIMRMFAVGLAFPLQKVSQTSVCDLVAMTEAEIGKGKAA